MAQPERIVPRDICRSTQSVDQVKQFYEDICKRSGHHVGLSNQCKRELLSWAIYLRNFPVCQYLIKEEKVNINWDVTGKMPLHRAVYYGYREIIELILNAIKPEDITSIDIKDDLGLTPLFWSILMAKDDLTQLLLSKGADSRHTSQWEFTNKVFWGYARRAAVHKSESPAARFWKLLFETKESSMRNSMIKEEEQFWKNCLFWWKVLKHAPLSECRIPLENGANPDCIIWVAAPIHSAAWQGNVEVIRLHIDIGFNIEKEDKWKRTALWYASGCGHINCVKILLDHGANPYYPTFDPRPLEMAEGAAASVIISEEKEKYHQVVTMLKSSMVESYKTGCAFGSTSGNLMSPSKTSLHRRCLESNSSENKSSRRIDSRHDSSERTRIRTIIVKAKKVDTLIVGEKQRVKMYSSDCDCGGDARQV
eukprot:m.133170 g.133170  ORF g.133170 m.133170 type:complete len:423 (+) comp38113_c0_seq2:85-1353(+)